MSSKGELPEGRENFGNEDPVGREESLEGENSEESLIVYFFPFYFNWSIKTAFTLKAINEPSWPTLIISFYNVSRPLHKV